MVKVKDICDYINRISPYETQCGWDNCGMLVGDSDKQVNKIAFALDLTSQTLKKSTDFGAELIITHHPVIFKAQKNFLKGNLVYELAMNGISAISAHTCFDCAEGGVNDVLCEILDIKDAEGVPSEECSIPMARIGNINEISSSDFAHFVAEKLDAFCRVADVGNTIKRVAVCGGAGMDFFDKAVEMGADAYVTGDASHHHFLDAAEKNITLIAAGHFETEFPAILRLMDMISNQFAEVECLLIDQKNPVEYLY